MRMFIFILLFCIAGSIMAADEILRGTALWVVDGDTILLRSGNKLTTVRLWGIDAPEKKQAGGKASTSFLVRLIGRKRVIVLTGGNGKYGRVLGKIYYKKKFINLEMVKAGHAWWNERYCPKAKEIKEAEKNAKKEKLGLWKNPNAIKPELFRHSERQISKITARETPNYLRLQIFSYIQ